MMFFAEIEGSVRAGWKISIYKPRSEPTNELIATVFGWSKALTTQRAQAILKALQELEKVISCLPPS